MISNYVTGAMIKQLREKKGLTQEQLAEKVFVSSKAVSKWETGRGFPDISLLERLSEALGISVIELLSGKCVENSNKAANIAKTKIYVCPVCANAIFATGESLVSCCGIALPEQEAESEDDDHKATIEEVEDELFLRISHPMTKEHYISFAAAISDNGVQFVKFYPEQAAECRFKKARVRNIVYYCNQHGLFFKTDIPKSRSF